MSFVVSVVILLCLFYSLSLLPKWNDLIEAPAAVEPGDNVVQLEPYFDAQIGRKLRECMRLPRYERALAVSELMKELERLEKRDIER